MSERFEEQAIEREDDEVLEDLGAAGLREMRMIEAALDRIENGSYGVCVRCGEPIGDDAPRRGAAYALLPRLRRGAVRPEPAAARLWNGGVNPLQSV